MIKSLKPRHIPLFVKKISIKAVLVAFRGLVGLKRLATLFVFWLKRPGAFVWRIALCPVLTAVYRTYRRIRSLVRIVMRPAVAFIRGILSGRSAATALVVMLVFAVTAGNISARTPDPSADAYRGTSIIAGLSPDHSERELVVEDAVTFGPEFKAVSYLQGQGIRATLSAVADTASQEQVAAAQDPATEIMQSHIVNAVRIVPETASLTETGVVPSTRTTVVDYTVQDGESIGSIAQRFGLKTTTLLWENDLSSRSIIRPGQALRVLPVDGITYKVKSGDTVLSLAKRYKTTAEKILDVNGLRPEDDILIGHELVLPDATPPPPPAPAPRPATIAPSFTPSPATDDAGGEMLWPTSVRRITQYYSWRHTGVDIAGPMRTPIYAAESGTVTFSGWNSGGYGNMIIIDHGNGLYTRYAHATRNLVKSGDQVERGQVIQLMGSTGRSTGPHIHFEVMKGGIYSRVNPFNYVK